MANEYAIKQATEHIEGLKSVIRQTEKDIFNHSSALEFSERQCAEYKQSLKEMERAKAILEEAQKDA